MDNIKINLKISHKDGSIQSINMGEYAYNNFVNYCLVGMNPAKWNSLSKRERIFNHLKVVAESLGGDGVPFEFTIFN